MSAYGDDDPPGGRPPRSTGRPSTGGHHQLLPMGVAIPGRQRPSDPPPPLPPPRHVDVDMDTFAAGSQSPRWQWDSEGSFGKSRGSAPGLDGFPKNWARGRKDDGASSLSDNRRRQSDNDAIGFGKDPRYDSSTRFDEGYHSMSIGLPPLSSQSVSLPSFYAPCWISGGNARHTDLLLLLLILSLPKFCWVYLNFTTRLL